MAKIVIEVKEKEKEQFVAFCNRVSLTQRQVFLRYIPLTRIRLTEDEKETARTLWKQGAGYRRIAKELKHREGIVQGYINSYVADLKRSKSRFLMLQRERKRAKNVEKVVA